jgi:Novel STAND NTPase 1
MTSVAGQPAGIFATISRSRSWRTQFGVAAVRFVSTAAEAVYEQLPPEQRPLLRNLLLRLVALIPDGQPVRGRVSRRTLATDVVNPRASSTGASD